jgi:catechol 2,3-dioxygenase-like lactoylglutathione lyase family enzyme
MDTARMVGLGWLGVRTSAFEATVALYRDVLGLTPFVDDARSVRFRLENGVEVHVYGPADSDHAFFGSAPVVGLRVDDVDETRRLLEQAGIELLTPIERVGGDAWCHFRAPDGNVYEIIGPDRADRGRVGVLA